MTPAEFKRSLADEQAAFERRQAERKQAYVAVVQRTVDAVGKTLQLQARAPGNVSLADAKRANKDVVPRWEEMFGQRWDDYRPLWRACDIAKVKDLHRCAHPLFSAGDYSTAAFSLSNIHCVKQSPMEDDSFYVYFSAVSECGCACKSEPTTRETVGAYESGSGMGYTCTGHEVTHPPRIRVVALCFVHAGQQDPAEELQRCLREQRPDLAQFLPAAYRFAPLDQALARWTPDVGKLSDWSRRDLGLTR